MPNTYTQYGPWTNNGSPGIASAFLNALEAFLLTINTAANDASISSDGAGNETLASATANSFHLSGAGAVLQLLAGTLSRVSFFSGTGNATVAHGLGATPTFVLVMYAGSGTPFGSLPTHPIYYYNAGVSTVQVVADAGYSWVAMAFHS